MAKEGQTAFITGASSGIGYAVSKALALAGVKVVVAARRVEKLVALSDEIKSGGGEVSHVQCDVADPESLAAAFAFAEQELGSISLVFCNAGVEGPVGPGVELSNADDGAIKRLVDINVSAAISTLKHSVVSFRKSGGGKIAFSSSIGSLLNPRCAEMAQSQTEADTFTQWIPYTATKAALDHIVKLAAGAYARENIQVYALNYGTFSSEMNDRLIQSFGDGLNAFNPYFKSSSGDPASIAAVLLAILDGSSKWLSGDVVVVDHDATIDAKIFYAAKFGKPGPVAAMGWPAPATLKPILKDTTGNPYRFQRDAFLPRLLSFFNL